MTLLFLQLPLLRDGGEAGAHLVVDRHGLGHHAPHVARVGREEDGGSLLCQLTEGRYIFLSYGQTGCCSPVVTAESLERKDPGYFNSKLD